MLVWYRDTTYGNDNMVTPTTTALPSTGSKGGLLLVDSHFDPFRRSRRGGRQGFIDAQQLAVAPAVVEYRVRPAPNVPVP